MAPAPVLMAVSLAISIALLEPPWLQAGLAALGIGLAAWLYNIPSRDHP